MNNNFQNVFSTLMAIQAMKILSTTLHYSFENTENNKGKYYDKVAKKAAPMMFF
mgnify:CR=1 FL=1